MHEASLEIEVIPNGGTVTLVLDGELDLATAGTLRTCLHAIDGAFQRVTLDLRLLRFMDSSGTSTLVEAHRRFDREMRQLVLRSPRGVVAQVVQVAGLATVMPVEDGPLVA
jgi:anti-anti-sigma factor